MVLSNKINSSLVLKAAQFAAIKHRDQRRKDVESSPIIIHKQANIKKAIEKSCFNIDYRLNNNFVIKQKTPPERGSINAIPGRRARLNFNLITLIPK